MNLKRNLITFNFWHESRRVFKNSVHYAVLGNQPDTPLPIVDPNPDLEIREEIPILDKGRIAKFAVEHAEQYRWMMRELVPRLHKYTGGKLREMDDLPNVPPEQLAEIVEGVREKIIADIAHWPFLEKYTLEHRIDALEDYARQADELVDYVIREWMPNLVDQISLSNEVKGTNDPAELLIMAFNRSLNPKTRFEARRKFLLMKMLGELSYCDESRRCQNKAMSRLNQVLNGEMYAVPDSGERIGDQEVHHLVSSHDSALFAHRTLRAVIAKDGSEAIDLLSKPKNAPRATDDADDSELTLKSTSLAMRRIKVRTISGQQREIDCFVDLRERHSFSRVIKKIHRDEPVEKLDHDYNGLRLVFKTAEDLQDFLNTLKEKIRNGINVKLTSRLRQPGFKKGAKRRAIVERLRTIENSVKAEVTFNNLNGKKKGKLKMKLIRLTVTDEDNNTYEYEFQAFLPEGYADYKFREFLTRGEHQVLRFFDGPSKLMFPTAIYPGLNHQSMCQAARTTAYASAWEKGAVETD
ncbi:MAG: hypothetical protein V1908_00205 [Candidatus Peregrinibacteria bacterium]